MHCLFLLAIDLLIVFASSITAILLTSNLHLEIGSLIQAGAAYGLLMCAGTIPLFVATGLHRRLWRFASLQDCLRILLALGIATLAVAATANNYPSVPGGKSLLFLQFAMTTGAVLSVRMFMRLRHAWRRRRRYQTNSPEAREDVIVIGLNAITELFLRCVAEGGAKCLTVVGILSEMPRHWGRLLRSCPILGSPENIEKIMHELEVHGVHIRRVVVAMPFEKLSPGSQKVLLRLDRERKIRLEALNHSFGLEALRADDLPPQATGVPASPMQQSRPFAFGIEQQLSPAYLFWKRGFDIALSLLAIVCLLPPMLCVTAFVFFDVGYPVIFWQQRPGTRGRPIKVLKFRTMRSAYDSTGRRLPDSERLSPIGAFLRRMRVDELPQIFNVLTGEMSIIGPRPLLPIDQSPDFSARLEMRPGLTGWAQINGGRHLSIADKAALDLWYVNNASFRVDIRILLMTVRTVLFGERIDDRAIRSAWQTLGVEPAPTGEKDNAAADTVEMDHWYQPAPVPYPPGPQVRKC